VIGAWFTNDSPARTRPSKGICSAGYSVVLLDEIEKAHPDIYNLLLQVLEDGRLTDNYGNVIDFTNSLIIMTSNLGGRELVEREGVGFTSYGAGLASSQVRELVDRELRRHFPPEFVNRLDEVIVFDSLDQQSMLEVARILLDETAEVLRKKNVSIEFEPDVATWLFDRCGHDPQAGARPLRRLVKLWIEDAVADFLIQNRTLDSIELRMRVGEDQPIVDAKGKHIVTQGTDA